MRDWSLSTDGGRPAKIGGGSSVFKLMKRDGDLNISPVLRIGQVKIENSCKTSFIQRPKWASGALNYCIFRASRDFHQG